MSRFLNGLKSFAHSVFTSDHYASYDPSGQPSEDTAPLAHNEDRRSSSSSLGSQYVPGMRSAQFGAGNTRDSISLGDLPPVPSPELSWSRIDAWIEQNYPELFDQILDGATNNDLNDFEHDLDCILPPDVRESYRIHDGQERGGLPTGVFFGITLLDLEQVSEEWNIWKRAANHVEELQRRTKQRAAAADAARPTAGSSTSPPPSSEGAPALAWTSKQASFPVDTVQNVYAHPGWIPLAKDQDGNNIAVDLAPGPKGRVGQVILFGRDFDTKFVVSPSWGDFLAQFAADLESGNSYIEEDTQDAVFAFKSPAGQLVSYFNVLRKRAERAEFARHPPQQGANAGAAPAGASTGAASGKPTPRRSMANAGASVSHAPVNSGRVTPRLVSPTNSSTNLPSNGKKNGLPNQLNEVSLDDKETELEAKEPEPELHVQEPEPEVKETEAPKEEAPKVETPKEEVKDEIKETETAKETAKEEAPKEEPEVAKEEETPQEEPEVAKEDSEEPESTEKESTEEPESADATESTQKAPKKKNNKKNKKKN